MIDCTAFKEQAALFALGGLDSQARAECEAHLRQPEHEGCVEALHRAMEAADALSDPPPAPARVWAAIMARVGPASRQLRIERRRVLALAALAAGLAGVCVYLGAQHQDARSALAQRAQLLETAQRATLASTRERDDCLRQVERIKGEDELRRETVELLQLAGTALFALAPEKGQHGTANVILHTGVKKAYVVADGLATTSGDYEMWIAKGKRVVPAGLLKINAQGQAVLRVEYAKLLGEVGKPDAMMITLEPAGGSDVVRGPTILLGTLGT